MLTRETYNHYYDNNIESKWTPIEPIVKDIRIGKSQSSIIRRIQFSIQFVVVRTIHCFQGLSLNELVFDPINVKKYGLTYTTLSHILTKEKIFLLIPLQHEIFYVDPRVHIEMNILKTIATWISLIPQFKNLHNFHVII
jgi:hypothetical protein